MAEEKKPAAPAKGGGGGGKPQGAKGGGGRKDGGDRKSMLPKGVHAGKELPVPPPRLRIAYHDKVKATLMEKLDLANKHQVPALEKIVVNVGLGEAIKQPKMLDSVVEELAIITGQRPVRKRARKSIANYGLRQGQEI